MKLFHGDCLEVLKAIPSESVDSLVTDPPAGISFMGKSWDDDKGGRKQWIAWMTSVTRECLRILKPGAHGLVWALPRTSHWTATALEDAGFEVRDVVVHLFGTGFPKSMDISKAIDAAKVLGSTRPEDLRKMRMGDAYAPSGRGRINYDHGAGSAMGASLSTPSELVTEEAKQWQGWGTALKPASEHWILIRKPCSEKTVAANVLKWGTGGINIDASRIPANKDYYDKCASVVGLDSNRNGTAYGEWAGERTDSSSPQGRFPANLVLDEEAACALDEQNGANSSRFFYVAKASKTDKGSDNTHPTVKSTVLMEYLIKLITPPLGVVLDPFMGSGSTGVAASRGGFDFIGIEEDIEYLAIAKMRMMGALDMANIPGDAQRDKLIEMVIAEGKARLK